MLFFSIFYLVYFLMHVFFTLRVNIYLIRGGGVLYSKPIRGSSMSWRGSYQ